MKQLIPQAHGVHGPNIRCGSEEAFPQHDYLLDSTDPDIEHASGHPSSRLPQEV